MHDISGNTAWDLLESGEAVMAGDIEERSAELSDDASMDTVSTLRLEDTESDAVESDLHISLADLTPNHVKACSSPKLPQLMETVNIRKGHAGGSALSAQTSVPLEIGKNSSEDVEVHESLQTDIPLSNRSLVMPKEPARVAPAEIHQSIVGVSNVGEGSENVSSRTPASVFSFIREAQSTGSASNGTLFAISEEGGNNSSHSPATVVLPTQESSSTTDAHTCKLRDASVEQAEETTPIATFSNASNVGTRVDTTVAAMIAASGKKKKTRRAVLTTGRVSPSVNAPIPDNRHWAIRRTTSDTDEEFHSKEKGTTTQPPAPGTERLGNSERSEPSERISHVSTEPSSPDGVRNSLDRRVPPPPPPSLVPENLPNSHIGFSERIRGWTGAVFGLATQQQETSSSPNCHNPIGDTISEAVLSDQITDIGQDAIRNNNVNPQFRHRSSVETFSSEDDAGPSGPDNCFAAQTSESESEVEQTTEEISPALTAKEIAAVQPSAPVVIASEDVVHHNVGPRSSIEEYPTIWDVTQNLATELDRLNRSDIELADYHTETWQKSNSIRAKIDHLIQCMRELIQNQNEYIATEQYTLAAQVDDQLRELIIAINDHMGLLGLSSDMPESAVSDQCALEAWLDDMKLKSHLNVSALPLVVKYEARLRQSTTDKLSAVVQAKNQITSTRPGLIKDVLDKITFDSARTANDLGPVRFESSKLELESSQITSQRTIEFELRRVEQHITRLSATDMKSIEDANRKRDVYDREIAELELKLKLKRGERAAIQKVIDNNELRVTAVRGKFQKQLQRLHKIFEELQQAESDLQGEVEQMADLRESLRLARQETAERVRETTFENSVLTSISQVLLSERLATILEFSSTLRSQFLEAARMKEASDAIKQLDMASSIVMEAARHLREITLQLNALKRTNLLDSSRSIHSWHNYRAYRPTIDLKRTSITELQAQKSVAVAARRFRDAGDIAVSLKSTEVALANLLNEADGLELQRAEAESEVAKAIAAEATLREEAREEASSRAEWLAQELRKYCLTLNHARTLIQSFSALLDEKWREAAMKSAKGNFGESHSTSANFCERKPSSNRRQIDTAPVDKNGCHNDDDT